MARKAKRQMVEEDEQPAKTPEEIFKEHYPAILEAKVAEEKSNEEARKKRSIYRGALKVFKKAGGNVDALTMALALRNRDPEEVTREWRDVNRYARLMNLPIGAQLGLFEDGETVATKSENDKASRGAKASKDKTLSAARKEGQDAGGKGKSPSENRYEVGSPHFLAWEAGWKEAQAAIAAKLGKGRNGKGAAPEARV